MCELTATVKKMPEQKNQTPAALVAFKVSPEDFKNIGVHEAFAFQDVLRKCLKSAKEQKAALNDVYKNAGKIELLEEVDQAISLYAVEEMRKQMKE
jgi:hypothetical protein